MNPSSTPSHRDILARLKPFFWPHKLPMLASIAAFILLSLTEPLIPYLLKVALDDGFLAQPSFPLWAVPLTLVALFFLRGLLSFIGTYLLHLGTSRSVLDLRNALSTALLKVDASVYAELPPGVVVSKVIHDPQNVANGLGGALLTLLRDGATAAALLAYLLWHNWQLTLLSMASVPLLAYWVKKLQKRIMTVGSATYEAQNRLAGIADDTTRAWRVIRTFDATDHERQRFHQQAKQVHRFHMKTIVASALMSPISQLASSIGLALVITLALYQAQTQGHTVGDFAAYVSALLLMVSKTRHLTDLSQPITAALVTARGCFQLFDAPVEKDDGSVIIHHANGNIVFDSVQLRYPGADRYALHGLSLHIQPETTVALVGGSGAGKSSVIHALLGFTTIEKGDIHIDGISIHDLRKADLRRQFAVVSQDIALFDASIADNVMYAAQANPNKLEACLRAAALWDYVQTLPEGIHTVIGINGAKLSGGQRQRLAIARALYKDAPIWLFDEATSALDNESEQAIQQALQQWHGKKTMVVIAHRLSTIRQADCIYVMEDGRVVERGNHDELNQRQGRYYHWLQLTERKAST